MWLALLALASAGEGPAVSYARAVRPLLEARCVECHNPDKHKGALDLTSVAALMRGGESGPVIARGRPEASALLEKVAGPDPEMPPTGPHLTGAEIATLTRWIAAGAADDAPAQVAPPPVARRPARAGARRLTRVEYDRTVREVLGSALRPAAAFPPDGASHGFDRVSDAQAASPLLAENYERAAEVLAAELVGRPLEDPARRRLLPCDLRRPGAGGCAERALVALAPRLWRRPARAGELEPFLALLRASAARGRADQGVRLALSALLLTPDFLYLAPVGAPADPFAVASRLSYFLWSAPPDEALLGAASDERLATRVQVLAQVDRMLDDARAGALAEDFVDQWLELRKLDLRGAYGRAFKGWNAELRASMKAEPVALFRELLAASRPAGELLTARFTFVDRRLAPLYAVEAPADGFARVALDRVPRAGLLTQPAILTLTSHPDRTSPTGRGAFVLDRLLCEPPPPPPPDVPAIETAEGLDKAKQSVRRTLERHRTAANCRVCHLTMDGIGLSLEAYDLVGRHRTHDNGVPIDTAGEVEGLGRFAGPIELAARLAAGPRFERCLTRQLLTYAAGRGFAGPADEAAIDHVLAAARAAGGSLRDVVRAVAASDELRGVVEEAP